MQNAPARRVSGAKTRSNGFRSIAVDLRCIPRDARYLQAGKHGPRTARVALASIGSITGRRGGDYAKPIGRRT